MPQPTTNTPRPLGRHREHDPASRAYAFTLTAPPTTSVRWTRHAPIFDQGTIGSCCGNACLGALGTSPLYDALAGAAPVLDEAHAVALYSLATTLDGIQGSYPPDDTGSSGLGVAKAAQQDGWLSGYTHAFGFDAALAALAAGPVITGVDWYTSFDTPGEDGEMAITPGAQSRGGHELVVDEVDVENRRVWISNSWGPTWGIHGRAWWSYDTWQRLLEADGDATILIPRTQPAPVPTGPVKPMSRLAAFRAAWLAFLARLHR